jgi:diguanylate cyclase (GGDEF)-like protein/PAS domain S-box-containing protein
MDMLPQPAYSRAPQRQRNQPARGRRSGPDFEQQFGRSPYFAFSIDEAGNLLHFNAHGQPAGAAIAPDPAGVLYTARVLPMLHNEAMPARMRGYWRGEVALAGRDGRQHPVTQTIEWRPHDQPPCFLCLAYPQDDYDVYESRLRFKYLFEAHPQPMWVYDLETLRFLVVNAAAVAQYGYTEAEFLQLTIRDIRPPDQWERLNATWRLPRPRAPNRPALDPHAARRQPAAGGNLVALGHLVRPPGAAGVCPRHHRAPAAEAGAAVARPRAGASVNAIVITAHAPEGDLIEYANPAFARLFGHAPDHILGQRLESLLGLQAQDEQHQPLAAALQAQQEATLLLRTRHRDGAQLWTQLHVAPVHAAEGAIGHHVCVLTDMTAIMDYQAQLEHQANHDALTGLPNRALLSDRMAQAVTFSQRFKHSLWLVLIDLDNFKLINDNLGHQFGDELLCAIAGRLCACANEGDTVARLGGDEFVLLLPVANQRPMASILQLVQEAVAAPVTLGQHVVTITCSIGVSVYPADGSEPEQLLKHADIALYRAKEAGRNQVQFYEAAMHARMAERALIESELRHALARGQLSLVYQPKLDLHSDTVTGMEALVRWQHPTLGRCRRRASSAWPRRPVDRGDRPLGAAHRLRPGQGLAGRGPAAAAGGGQPVGAPVPRPVAAGRSARRAGRPRPGAQYLELELTESLMMHNVDEVVALVKDLKQLGIALSIDDFGTGYSSLAYLKQFPVDS